MSPSTAILVGTELVTRGGIGSGPSTTGDGIGFRLPAVGGIDEPP